MNDNKKGLWKKGSMITLALLLSAGLVFSLLPAGSAQGEGGNRGTIKVHDELDADPDERNEPHVSCDFWVEGFNMASENGTLHFFDWPPTGDKTEVMNDTWVGVPEEDGRGFHFLNGPYELEPGHYRVEAHQEQGKKVKMFWVDECEEPGEPEPLLCPTGLEAVVNEDGSVLLTFAPAEGSNGTNVYRAEGDADAALIAELDANATSFLDEDTTAGATLSYEVRAVFGELESEDCPVVVVEIPDGEPEPEPEPGVACPSDLGATANADSSILVSFAPAQDSIGSRVYRTEAGGERMLVAELDAQATTFLDVDTVVGTTYTYEVTALYEGGVESGPCPTVEVTAIPVFTTAGAMVLASVVGAVAYAGLRRRF